MSGLTAASADPAAAATDDTSVDSVEVRLPTDVSAEVRRLATNNGWPEEEAFFIVLTYGLNFLRQHQSAGYDEPGMFRDADTDRIKARLVQLESLYAAMKFRAFTLKRDDEIFDMRDQALAIENNALRAAQSAGHHTMAVVFRREREIAGYEVPGACGRRPEGAVQHLSLDTPSHWTTQMTKMNIKNGPPAIAPPIPAAGR
jgi:hypothetical protein